MTGLELRFVSLRFMSNENRPEKGGFHSFSLLPRPAENQTYPLTNQNPPLQTPALYDKIRPRIEARSE
jgi:hypothetical protein